MAQQRKHSRVDVNLPVGCAFPAGRKFATGQVFDLSEGGMKVSVPLEAGAADDQSLHYYLQLPAPFAPLTGSGEIRWRQKDAANQRLLFGLAFSSLSEEQRLDLASIITELREDN